MSVVVSQMGARMHYAVPRILHEAGALERLYTDICAVQGFPRLLAGVPQAWRPRVLRRLLGRVPADLPRSRIKSFPAMGAWQVMERMRARGQSAETRLALIEARAFSRAVVRGGFGQAAGFYGISGECLEQLRAAKARGLWTVVEQIIAPRAMVERLIAAEARRFPEWGCAHFDAHAWAFAQRERREWEIADRIVCPSEFVRNGIIAEGGSAEKCVVVPYGIDVKRFSAPPRRRPGRLRVLTVGAIGLRKGSPYVIEAARRLGDTAEFRMIGGLAGLPRDFEKPQNLQLLGTVPRAEMAAHFAWGHVFLLPSACEGSATVTYEALAAGLPVITTPNAGSVVEDGVSGYIVPLGHIDAIVSALKNLNDEQQMNAMSRAALARAAEFDLANYGKNLLAALESLAGARK